MPKSELTRFSELRGHDRAIHFLRKAGRDGTLAHSLLFAGPDGIGKRSLAVGFAAWILCEVRGDDGCGACNSCLQIAASSHPALRIVTLPNGKKEIGVDHARELKRWLALRSSGPAKIAILLDADRLTLAAQNALLKTLEEPPADVFLVVVTNNADALLPTVRSRCQRIPIRPLPDDVVESLLIEREEIPAERARELASLAEGSPGRAIALQEMLGKESVRELLAELATLSSGRYGRLSQMATSLNSPEAGAPAKLEYLLSRVRDAALALPPTADSRRSYRTLLKKADAVAATLSTIRRTNPNRQLLLESLLLQLASSNED